MTLEKSEGCKGLTTKYDSSRSGRPFARCSQQRRCHGDLQPDGRQSHVQAEGVQHATEGSE